MSIPAITKYAYNLIHEMNVGNNRKMKFEAFIIHSVAFKLQPKNGK